MPVTQAQAMLYVCVAVGMTAAFAVPDAYADTRVDYLQVEKQSSFGSNRVYAGMAVAKRASELGFKQGGEILEVSVDVGDRVKKGDVLARLDSQSLQAALSEAQASLELAQATLVAQQADTELAIETEQRFKNLKARGHVSAQEYDEARLASRSAEAQVKVATAAETRANAALSSATIMLREARVIAPFDGVVQDRYYDEGSQVASGAALLRLVASDNIEAHVGVPAAVAMQMELGQSYPVRWNNTDYPATLRAIPPEIDSATRTMTAVLELDDAEIPQIPQIPMGAVVELTLSQQIESSGFWVPLSALTESDRGLWGVYVVNADSVVERHLVEVVHAEAERVFVRGTLSASDRVIRTGVQRIVPGQRVELSQQ